MQRQFSGKKLTDEERIKSAGLVLDFDEIARKGTMSKEEVLVAKWYGIYTSRQRGDHMARVWRIDGAVSAAPLAGHDDKVLDAAWSPDGKRIVTASADRTARVWSRSDAMGSVPLIGHRKALWDAGMRDDAVFQNCVNGQRYLAGGFQNLRNRPLCAGYNHRIGVRQWFDQ